jgi:hypothetical protein
MQEATAAKPLDSVRHVELLAECPFQLGDSPWPPIFDQQREDLLIDPSPIPSVHLRPLLF